MAQVLGRFRALATQCVRWPESLLLGFALGVWGAQQQHALFPYPFALAMCAVGTYGAIWGVLARSQAASRARCALFLMATGCLGAALGFASTTMRAQARLAETLPPELEDKLLLVEGVVAALPTHGEEGTRFAFDIERVRAPEGATVPRRVSLAWKHTHLGDPLPTVRAGERWLLAVRLQRPHGVFNPHGFDLEAWMFERGLRASGWVSQNETVHQRLRADAGRWQDRIERWRERVREQMQRTLREARWSGVLVALAIGDQASVARSEWATFNAAGISHLLSISGAHVTLFAAGLSALVYGLWRQSQALTLRLPARKAALAVAVFAAFAYALAAGFAAPAQRTCFMVMIVALGFWRGMHVRSAFVLLFALACVLLRDPWAVLSAGFWFSFVAVAGLLWLAAYRVGKAPWWKTALVAQLALFILLAPIGLALFQQFSLVGLFVNAVAIPLVSFVVVPLTLLWLLIPWAGLLWLAHGVWSVVGALCEWVSAWPLATWQQHAPPPWSVALAMVGAFWLIGPRAFPGKPLAAALMLPLFVIQPTRPAYGAFSVTALDVGQGLAIVVQTRRYDLLYDTGPVWTENSDAGQRIIVPYLRATGARLGGLVVSHQDSDHAGGVASVIRERRPDWVRSSFAARPEERCTAGQSWIWDGVVFTFLHPAGDAVPDAKATRRHANNRSCVLRIVGRDGASALLTGDIETDAEAELLASGQALQAALLSVPHHGSRSSSSAAFVAAVAPQRAVIHVGYRNRFAHPHPEVLATYHRRDVVLDRTDWHGAVRYTWDGQTWQATRWRERAARYWHLQE